MYKIDIILVLLLLFYNERLELSTINFYQSHMDTWC